MALAFRSGSFVSAGNASGGNLSLTKPTGTADGDVVCIMVYFEPDTCTITVSPGSWESVTIANTGAFKLQCFFRVAASEGTSYTISNDVGGNQWRAACGVAYSGSTGGAGTRLDVSSTNQGDAQLIANQTAPSVTPTGTNRMIVYGYANFSGTDGASAVGFATNFRGTLGGCALTDALQATATATGTTRINGGSVGTEDFAALHAAIISDLAGGRASKNTRSNPLGVNLGMGWRMPG